MLGATQHRYAVSASTGPCAHVAVGAVHRPVTSVHFVGAQPVAPAASELRNARWHAPLQRHVRVCGQANSSLSLPIDIDLETPLRGFDSIGSALAALAAGEMVVVIDDEDRENEGDLIMNADKVTTEAMAFIVEHTSGVVCIAMEGADLDRLRLPLMVSSAENEEAMYTAFAITVDLKDGITTGISASDRAKTIRRLADASAVPADFRRPGHIFPLRYRPGGVIVRPGHTEASVDLARMSGSFPAGVLCEIVDKADGSMARTPQLQEFAKRHGLKCITIADMIRYRLRHEQVVQAAGPAATVTTLAGAKLQAHSFKSAIDGVEHLVLVHGSVAAAAAPVALHIHHERTVADLLHCGPASTSSSPTLDDALRGLTQSSAGALVYLRTQTSKGVQPSQELEELQAGGAGGSQQQAAIDLKEVATATQMLRALGVQSVCLHGGSEALATALRSCGLEVAGAGSMLSHNGNGSNNGYVTGKALAGAGAR